MTERVPLTCEQCSAVFYRLPCQFKRKPIRFCSWACFAASMRRGTLMFCAMCDTEFYKQLAEQDSGKHFCSRDCYMDFRHASMKATTYPKNGRRHAHRVIAEQLLGRDLSSEEIIHHIDLNRHNTDPINLAVFPDQSYHMRCHQGSMSDEELNSFRLVALQR